MRRRESYILYPFTVVALEFSYLPRKLKMTRNNSSACNINHHTRKGITTSPTFLKYITTVNRIISELLTIKIIKIEKELEANITRPIMQVKEEKASSWLSVISLEELIVLI